MLNKKDLVNLEGLFMLYAVKTNDGKVLAAKNMNTSVDTLNKYLEILEKELGSRLLAISDRRCTLTGFGEQVFNISDQIIKNLKLAYSLKEKENSLKGNVRIACDRGIKHILNNGSLEKFLDKYSDITLSIDAFDSMQNINFKDYDLFLSYDFPKDKDVVILLTKNSSCGFFASNNYLSHHPEPKSIEDVLQNHRLVLKHCWAEVIQNNFKKFNKHFCLSNSNMVVNEIVNSGGGVGFLPVKLASKYPNLVPLTQIKYDLQANAYLFTRREIKDLPRIRVVIDYYKNLLKSI